MTKCDFQVMITDQPHSHSEAYCLVWCRRSTDRSWRRGDILFHPLQSGQASPPWTYQNTGQQTKQRTTTTLTNPLSDECVCETGTSNSEWLMGNGRARRSWGTKVTHTTTSKNNERSFPSLSLHLDSKGCSSLDCHVWDIPVARMQREGRVCVLCFYMNTRRRNHKAPLWIFDQKCSYVCACEREEKERGKRELIENRLKLSGWKSDHVLSWFYFILFFIFYPLPFKNLVLVRSSYAL